MSSKALGLDRPFRPLETAKGGAFFQSFRQGRRGMGVDCWICCSSLCVVFVWFVLVWFSLFFFFCLVCSGLFVGL